MEMDKSTLIIEGNKKAAIKSITQWFTYGGLLEGLPTARINNQILKGLEEEIKKLCDFREIYIIEPTLTPIEHTGKYPFGAPISLPSVTCIVKLRHYGTFRNKKMDFSCLGLAWFQNEYAFPIDNGILEKIKEIPFSQICGEYKY